MIDSFVFAAAQKMYRVALAALLGSTLLLGGCASTGGPAGDAGATADQAQPDITTPTSIATPPIPIAIDLTVPPADLWQRMRNGFGMPDLHNPLVADRQSWYLNRPDMLRRIFQRGGRYLYHIIGELEKRGMPTELALLPMVESAYNPLALSSARAMGIWQFIPSTGKSYQLDQNWWVDERRDIIASTDAALDYLQNIYEMNGDWHLALASYNWGENAVARAMAKNAAKGLSTDYGSLTMPVETRYYVPKLQALKNIVAQPELFGFHLPPISNQPYFETVLKPELMDIAVAARLAEIPIEEFVSLNPAYHRPVMHGNQAGPLVLPAGKVDTYLANLERYEARDIPLSNWLTYTIKKGDTLAKVAANYKISQTQLERINGITRRIKVGPGFNLLVPRPGSQASELVSHSLPKEPSPKIVVKKSNGSGKKAMSAAKKSKSSVTQKPKTVTQKTPQPNLKKKAK
jgi:membrane-bound lytic murein transglycosylase D